jgi:hypothetical protein
LNSIIHKFTQNITSKIKKPYTNDGIGAHLRKGDKHAEVQALDMAQSEAKGATIYVSLACILQYVITFWNECSIFNSINDFLNTCFDDFIYTWWRWTMIQYNAVAAQLYQDFFTAKRNGIPELTVKVSASLDGKQATDDGGTKDRQLLSFYVRLILHRDYDVIDKHLFLHPY